MHHHPPSLLNLPAFGIVVLADYSQGAAFAAAGAKVAANEKHEELNSKPFVLARAGLASV